MNENEKGQNFLNELAAYAETYADSQTHIDYEEVCKFVKWCCEINNKPVPGDIKPFDVVYDVTTRSYIKVPRSIEEAGGLEEGGAR